MSRVCIAAQARMYREGIARELARDARFTVVASVGNLSACVEAARAKAPDLIVIDVSLAESRAIIDEFLNVAPGVRVIALDVASVDDAVTCAELGFAGYVTCEEGLDVFADRIESVSRGEMPCSPEVASQLLSRVADLARRVAANDVPAQLTHREQEIARLLSQGLSNKEIASELRIEVTTVKNHVHNVLRKFGATRRREVEFRMRSAQGSHALTEI